jgi:hypothetical protein
MKVNSLTLIVLLLILSLIPVAFLSSVSASGNPAAESKESSLKRTADIHRDAFRKPFNKAAFNAYMETLPRDGDYFVVEGDLLLTGEELQADVVSKSLGAKPADPTRELIVKVDNGEREFYKDPNKRNLTYAVARSTFPSNDSYDMAVKNMQVATKAWEDACPRCRISFKHLPQHDVEPNQNVVNFTVRYHDARGRYVAAAFFPHDGPARRFVNLDPSYFRSDLRALGVGVLRHELGHVLGYRHEQLQDATPGCFNERAGEPDGLWQALTPYDSRSVMHYFCGPNLHGALNPELNLSSDDIAGHSELYKILPSNAGAFTLPSSGVSESTLKIHQAAYASPFNEDTVKAYIQTLPKDGDYFVVEGDLRMTEQELRAYLAGQRVAPKPAANGGELLVNVIGGEVDFYRNLSERTLTYAVDRKSFQSLDRYKTIVKKMELATKSWEAACNGCGLKFQHLAQYDPAPTNDKVNFTVRSYDSIGNFIASAFFPHDGPSRRFIDIDPSFFGPDLESAATGVLRHELGHTLGYRHEHIRGIPGCFTEGGGWLPLTPYDKRSVMHYWCGGGGNPRLDLSDEDKKAHLKLYSNNSAPSPNTAAFERIRELPELIIRLEGGNVAENAATVLSALNDLKLLRLDRHKVEANETLEGIYKSKLNFPFFTSGLKKFAGELNKVNSDSRDLKIGDEVFYPNLKFADYEYSINLDPTFKSDQQRLDKLLSTQNEFMRSKTDVRENGLTKLKFTGFEMRIPLNSDPYVLKLRERLKDIPAENLLIIYSVPSLSNGARLFASADRVETPADRFMQMARSPVRIPYNVQGLIGSFAGITRTQPDLNICQRGNACPEIVLIDTPVELHPDIAPAIKAGGNASLGRSDIVENDLQIIEVGDYNETADHGTYMAGIIASQDNNYGLIGLHPGAKITALDWLKLESRAYKLGELIQKRDDSPGMQIYVFASSWKWHPGAEDDLINSNAISRKIRNIAPLWITAAGQSNGGGGADIDRIFSQGPMNLGFLKNVIVVTAYRLDNQGVPHLLSDANYSSHGLVHIAAPGENIPSTISVSKYASGSGTSPATAFVAGVASGMVSKWDYYRAPDRVKFRLQLTATPSLPSVDANKVVSGVLDPALALLDPAREWIRNTAGDYIQVNLDHWCGSSFRIIDPVTMTPVLNGGNIEPNLIYRLYRVGNSDNWFIYTKVTGANGDLMAGELQRIGPGLLVVDGQITPAAPIFDGSDGTPYTSQSFRDVILSQALPVQPCQPQSTPNAYNERKEQ